MLKALEIQGFKSFADKTRFDFPAGITVVVGPNGSGKSNVVDAIKWVLGEQSAKSLRGKDMADVIFKGSGSAASGRKPMNFAEATIVFDNEEHRLAVDAPEVHVTRRVYRSGEGEYLINGQPCRLKDIKDLFRGTGVSVDAYSIIEQGKVDRLLQASTKDRRAMFEEAAGISRFKAKKVEAQRRLERVDQNLVRLRDIVEEVDSRLRGVRNQASKAQRYREHADRLQQLRLFTASTDWQTQQGRQLQLERESQGIADELARQLAECENAEANILEWETSLISAQEELRNLESRHAHVREQIASRENSTGFERARVHEQEEEVTRRRQQMLAMTTKAGDVRSRIRDIDTDLAQATADHTRVTTAVKQREQRVAEIVSEIQRIRGEMELQRREYVAAMRELAELGNQASRSATHRAAGLESLVNVNHQAADVELALENYAAELNGFTDAEHVQAEVVNAKHLELDAEQLEIDKDRLLLTERLDDLSHLRGRHEGAEHRLTLLKDLEQRREGLEAGVKDLLDSARLRNELGVRGLLADCISAPPEIAELIDLALGDLSQAAIVDGEHLRSRITRGKIDTKGRVLFVGLWPNTPAVVGIDLRGRSGVIERADRVAVAVPGYEGLLSSLLGSTWLVESLADAVRLRSEGAAGVRFISRGGERLEADGTLIVGSGRGAAGLISRRSELKSLQSELHVIQRLMDEAEAELGQLRQNIASRERTARRLADEHRAASARLSDCQVAVRTHQQQGAQLAGRHAAFQQQRSALEQQVSTATEEIKSLRGRQDTLEKTIASQEVSIAGFEQRVGQFEVQRAEEQRHVIAARIELGGSEQRVDALRAQLFQCEEDEKERDRILAQAFRELAAAEQRRDTAERRILHCTSDLAELYLHKESGAVAVSDLLHQCTVLTADKARRGEQVHALRRSVRKIEQAVQEKQLAAAEARRECQALLERIKEDYGIDLAALKNPPEHDERNRDEIEEEIAVLRKKINAIGAVNVDSLHELDELEARHAHLAGQYADLSQAKQALERIIHKINADSRRIFLETLEGIRTNFQALYRRAFGGGKADLALEEGVDVLESGVDILATPPGKPSFNNSLLSGGEKALTAVALLLAIFQFRPSPFCVLDEVDAPFDEANIGRFVEVLKDFLGWTRFIIVTHSKKTMTAANTLYGVTMQESGISKRVSVKFDDVTEDGHIRHEALEREAAVNAANAKGVA